MTGAEPMSFEQFRQSFYYGAHADMQFKFLARMDDRAAADAVAEVPARVGDTPTVDDAPFTPLPAALPDRRLALISAGGMFRAEDDPMGPDGPTKAAGADQGVPARRVHPCRSSRPTPRAAP